MDKPLKLSKRDRRIYEHLREFKTITSWEAIKEYGCTRLSDVIFHLRKQGVTIENEDVVDKNRFGEKIHYVRYHLYGEQTREVI